nr:sensor domain-containing diguanylate cyclase [Marinomonas ostreistagni]
MTDHLAVIDEQGQIVFVNESWKAFADLNACDLQSVWQQVNYLDVCDAAAANGDDFGIQASQGIRAVIAQTESEFTLEYPCHSPDQQRWFIMRVTPFWHCEQLFLVVAHQNVTERKLAEQKAERLANIDALTDIANRRAFEREFNAVWETSREHQQPLCLAFIDLDYFKVLNDTYGHAVGDECLSQFARLLERHTQAQGQFCARCGGEEFAIIWRNTALAVAEQQMQQLLDELRQMALANERSPVAPYLTVSAGLAEITPSEACCPSRFFSHVDERLYQAKHTGRDGVVASDEPTLLSPKTA